MADIYRDLARELRGRRLGESEIVDVLTRVSALAHERGERAGDIVGDPASFAKATPRGRATPPGVRFISVITVVAAVIVVGASIARYLVGVSPHLVGTWPWALALGLLVVGLVGGFTLDSRLPRGFVPGRDRGELDESTKALP